MKKKSAEPDIAETKKERKSRRQDAAKVQKKEQAASTKRGSGVTPFMSSALIIALLAVIGGSLALGWLQFARQQGLTEKHMADSLAMQVATIVDGSLQQAEQIVNAVSTHPLIDQAIAEPNGDLARAMVAAVPSGSLYLLGQDQVLTPESLSFSARNALKKAREADEVITTLSPGNPPVLYVARKTNGGGTALAQIPQPHLQPLLAKLNSAGALIELRLPEGNAIVTAGQANASGQSAIAPVKAGLEVVVTIPPGSSDEGLVMLFALATIGMVLLVTLAIVGAFIAAARTMKKDAAILAYLAEDLAEQPNSSARGALTLAAFMPVQASIRRLAKVAAKNKSRHGSRTKATAGDVEFPLTNDDQQSLIQVEDNQPKHSLPESIFREYDIRGVVGDTLTEEYVELLGRAIGTEALQTKQQTVIVARDGRTHSPQLAEALIRGLTGSGREVIDLGAVPTPVLYYGTHVLDSRTGVMITGSHNPANHNGLKIVIDGETLSGERIRALRERLERGELASGEGSVRQQDIADRYVNEIVQDTVLARPMKIAIDCGNGITGPVVSRLFDQLGCEVIPLHTEVDGTFPAHHPDTSKPENYRELIAAVSSQKADIGIAFDGDGDRLGVVTPKGEIIWPDRLMMLFARDLLSRSPGADIIFDVKCSRELGKIITRNGGRPVMWRTGHSLIKAKLKETGAPLAGEMSGHIFFADRWHGFDDGAYAAARLLEILSLESGDADALFAELTTGVATPEITVACADDKKFAVIEKLQSSADQFGGAAVTIDGLRVDFEDGWGLLRASNTTAKLVARFEGKDEAALARIRGLFADQLSAIDPQLKLPS